MEPLNRRPEERAVLPVLRDHAPLKFIRNISLSSRTPTRPERPRGRPRTGPLAMKGGSEESGSSSSSVDLEDEGESEAGDGGLRLFDDKRPPGDDLVQLTVGRIPLNRRSTYSGKLINALRLSPELEPDYKCGGKDSNPPQPAHRQTFRSTAERGEPGNSNGPAASECEEKVKSKAGQTPAKEVSREEMDEARGEPGERCQARLRCGLLTRQDFQVDDREDVKVQTEEKCPPSNPPESNTGVSEDSRKVVGRKERKMPTACSQGSNAGTNQRSINTLTICPNPSNLHRSKSTSIMSDSSSESEQNKKKGSRSPSSQREISSPLAKKKGSDESRRLKVKVSSSSRVQPLPALRELKDGHLLTRPSCAGSTRSMSAVAVVTYSDMFQQIQNGDGGPEIYQMFAGPLYDNLRASSSCDQVQDRKVQSAKAACRPLKRAHVRKSQAGRAEGRVASANAGPEQASSRQKNNTSALRTKAQKRNSTNKDEAREKAESALPWGPDSPHAREKDKEEMLATIEESTTFKSDGRTPTVAAGSSRNVLESKSNAREPLGGGSPAIISPVYQKFLDDVGEGPLTDELLQCLAEELISLDERETPGAGSGQEKPDTEDDPGSGIQEPSRVKFFYYTNITLAQ